LKKHLIIGFMTLIMTTSCLSSVVLAQVESAEFLGRWASSERYTLEVLDKMPDSGIQFKVDSSAMSFGEQIAHIGKTITMLSKNFFAVVSMALAALCTLPAAGQTPPSVSRADQVILDMGQAFGRGERARLQALATARELSEADSQVAWAEAVAFLAMRR
jgi:hypothetical protein